MAEATHVGALIDNRYLLERVLGRGGMGEVYRAADQQENGRQVAIKLLNSHSSEAVRARFLREARLASGLKHPHIVPVFCYARGHAERLYLSMELVDGVPLTKLLLELPTGAIVALLQQVLEALAHVHARGVLHRDVKPDNILIGRRSDGALVAKLTDFGIAGMTEPRADEPRLTEEGTMLGTPHYMAPEQASGALFIGPQADLYPVGVMLYEVFAQHLPFLGTPLQILLEKLHKDVPPPGNLSDWPAGLWGLVESLVARAPMERPVSAAAVTRALEPWSQRLALDAAAWARLRDTGAEGHTEVLHDAATVVSPSAEASAATAHSTPALLVPMGRKAEAEQLLELADDAEADEFRVALVRGPVGIGKSHLVEYIATRLVETGRFQHLQCTFGASTSAAGGLRALVERALDVVGRPRVEVEARAKGFLQRHGAFDQGELDELMAFVRPARGGPRELDGEGVGGASNHALVLRVLRIMGRRLPLVVLFEDVHTRQGREQVAGFLEMAAIESAYEPLPMLVLATSRSDADAELVKALRPLTRHDGLARRLSLKPLAVEVLADILAGRHAIGLAMAEHLAARAGGNPLFAELLVRSGAAERVTDSAVVPPSTSGGSLPDRLSALMLDQMESSLVGREDRELLEALLQRVALLGSPVSIEMLERTWEGLDGDFDDLLDAVIGLGILEEDHQSETVAFQWPLLEEAVAARFTGRKARKLHLRAAELRQAMGEEAGSVEREAWAIGRHFAAASKLSDAVDWWLRAMAYEMAVGDIQRAVDCGVQTLEHLPADDLRAGLVRLDLAQMARERTELEWALELVEPVVGGGDADQSLKGLEIRYSVLTELGRRDEALAAYEGMEQHAEAATTSGRRAHERARLFFANTTSFDLDETFRLAGELLASAPDRPDASYIQQRLVWAAILSHSSGRQGYFDKLRRIVGEVEHASRNYPSGKRVHLVETLGLARGITDGYDAAVPLFEEARELARRTGRPGRLTSTVLVRAFVAVQDDRCREALDLLNDAERLLRAWVYPELQFRHAITSFVAQVTLGDDGAHWVERLEQAFEELAGIAVTRPAKGWFRQTMAVRAARRGDWDEVARQVDNVRPLLLGWGLPKTLALELDGQLKRGLMDQPNHEHLQKAAADWLKRAPEEWAHHFPKRGPFYE